MQVDIEVESELDRVLVVVAGTNQRLEPPALYRVELGRSTASS